MPKVCIVGHTPDNFDNESSIKQIIEDNLIILLRQYGPDELILNTCANIGIEQWAIDIAIENKIIYNIYLPFPVECFKNIWYSNQVDKLTYHINNAKSITISRGKEDLCAYSNCMEKALDESGILLAFWNKKHQGRTFSFIKRTSIKSNTPSSKINVNSLYLNLF
jgi:uncharacterized phage-like protein YoqJ